MRVIAFSSILAVLCASARERLWAVSLRNSGTVVTVSTSILRILSCSAGSCSVTQMTTACPMERCAKAAAPTPVQAPSSVSAKMRAPPVGEGSSLIMGFLGSVEADLCLAQPGDFTASFVDAPAAQHG